MASRPRCPCSGLDARSGTGLGFSKRRPGDFRSGGFCSSGRAMRTRIVVLTVLCMLVGAQARAAAGWHQVSPPPTTEVGTPVSTEGDPDAPGDKVRPTLHSTGVEGGFELLGLVLKNRELWLLKVL